jgi:integrase
MSSRADFRNLEEIFHACEGAYSIRTIKGYAADLGIFVDWCRHHGADWLPATPASVAAFVDDQVTRHRISTIKRRLCAIAFAHRMRDLPVPTEANVVHLAVRRANRKKAMRPKQVYGLTHDIRAAIIAHCPPTLAGLRDAALIGVGYDTLCRSSELSAMRVEHVRYHEDGSVSILIPRSKADIAGQGRVAYVSPETARLLSRWTNEAGLTEGPLFRSLHLARVPDGPLVTSSIRRLIKRAAERAGLGPPVSCALSGHSMRIGAAQDMLVAGFDALAIMQAGGWKSANVVLRYVENAATRDLHERRWQLISAGMRMSR